MKKSWIVFVAMIFGGVAMAGGDVLPTPYVEDTRPCVEGAVYVQKEVNLMWQDELYNDDEEGAYRNGRSSGKVGNLEYAKEYCRSLTYYGYSDWRLPTLEELLYLHQRPTELKHSIASDFWSSTPDKGDNQKALYTADGSPYIHKKNKSLYFRCIRCFKDTATKEHPASCRR